jgi:hypothetical protein
LKLRENTQETILSPSPGESANHQSNDLTVEQLEVTKVIQARGLKATKVIKSKPYFITA